jgi:hypothetical protein
MRTTESHLPYILRLFQNVDGKLFVAKTTLEVNYYFSTKGALYFLWLISVHLTEYLGLRHVSAKFFPQLMPENWKDDCVTCLCTNQCQINGIMMGVSL